MREEDRIAQLEARVKHLTSELAQMIERENERDRMIKEIYGEVVEPSVHDDSWFSIKGLPEEMRDYADRRIVEIRRERKGE